MSPVIGELHFEQGKQAMKALLDADLHWRCDNREIETFLNAAYTDAPNHFLDVHRPAVHLLYQAAERLGAEVHVIGKHPAAVA